MIDDSICVKFQPKIQTMLVIAGFLIAGPVFFGIMLSCAVFEWDTIKPPLAMGLFPWLGIGVAGVALAAFLIVPLILRRVGVKQLTQQFVIPELLKDPKRSVNSLNENHEFIEKMLGIYQTAMIIGLAAIEIAVYANLVFFAFCEGFPVNLGIGVLGILLMVVAFPLPSRIWSWVESNLEDMQHHARGH